MKPHSFHIPVMGTGFTMDTPLKVARYGIASVISISDDRLLEKMREYHCRREGETFTPIAWHEPDARAQRITAYLNLVHRLVQKQIEAVKSSAFKVGSEITRYFEMLEDSLEEKKMYLNMLKEKCLNTKTALQNELRSRIVPGAIDVNIMSKVDRDNVKGGAVLPAEYSDALSALRGYAKSDLSSSRVVLSAGFNPRLYAYLPEFEDFYPDSEGFIRKKIALKISDYRSALIQGRFLAKKGIWVSEYRVESGLNCGGHAFPTEGYLLGPVLQEFKNKREELKEAMWKLYEEALQKMGKHCQTPPPIHLSAQGGVGKNEEQVFLKKYFDLDSVGWGTPFLLVPEATNVDEETLKRLVSAGADDILLSHSSPLGVPFYTLRNSLSEEAKQARIEKGHPGSPCPYGHLAYNVEYGQPLCTASLTYQKKKIDELKNEKLEDRAFSKAYEKIVEKACICYDLGAGLRLKLGLGSVLKKPSLSPAICPGPNLAFFSRIASLSEMVDHIYGRIDLISRQIRRPHVFINELKIYVDYLKDLVEKLTASADAKKEEIVSRFKQNLTEGIRYYRSIVHEICEASEKQKKEFLDQLAQMESLLEGIVLVTPK